MAPIRLRLALFLEKAQDRPGIIDFLAAKTIAIIPVTQDGQGLVLLLRTGQDPYFFWRETDPISIGPIDDTADFQIIQAAENTFFGNPQNACQYGKIQRRIRLQSRAEEIPHESHAFIIKTVLPGLLDRDIVLIQQEDYRLLMITIHHVHQAAQGLFHFDRRCQPVMDALKIPPFSS